VEHTIAIGRALGVKGLMNIQFVVMPPGAAPSRVYVLEVNPRASRTVPFISKVTGVPLVRLAVEVMLGRSLSGLGCQSGLWPAQSLVAVKAPVFSMSKLAGVDSFLGPEMKSTGEVMGVDRTYGTALAKALLAAGLTLPPQGAVLVSIADRDKAESQPIIYQLSELGYKLFATEGTAAMIEGSGLAVTQISKKLSQDYPTVVDIIREGRVDGVINTLTHDQVPLRDGFQIRRAATERRIPCFTSLDTARATVAALANSRFPFSVLPLREYLGGGVKGPA
jgi:carbamoyl-phosphate synthase large subunit